jgi:hypothetical protein
MTITTTTASAAATLKQAEPIRFVKRIGSTTYVISVATSPSATETLQDKLLRLIESEVRRIA